MKGFIALVGLVLLVASLEAIKIKQIDEKHKIEHQYIFVYRENITKTEKAQHLLSLTRNFVGDDFQNEILATYDIGTFQGFSAKLSKKLAKKEAENDDLFISIEQDAEVHAFQSCSGQNGATWGLDRIDSQAINLNGVYNYDSLAGSGTDSYVVDTGILISHKDFAGRAIWGANFADSQNTDCNGHGTHVAGTIGGTTYGVAKKTTLYAVKVLNCAGSGTNTGVISGVNWVVSNYQSRKRPSVANMSLGGGISTALDNAVTAAIKAGVTFAVAAGNENNNACNGSPSRVATAITVGATGTEPSGTKQVDNRAYFSNYGSCVTLFGPGLEITSDWIGSTSAVETISGTSMATPHVAGVVSLYLAENPTATPASVKSWLISNSGKNLIQLDCSGATKKADCDLSPNRMLYAPCSL